MGRTRPSSRRRLDTDAFWLAGSWNPKATHVVRGGELGAEAALLLLHCWSRRRQPIHLVVARLPITLLLLQLQLTLLLLQLQLPLVLLQLSLLSLFLAVLLVVVYQFSGSVTQPAKRRPYLIGADSTAVCDPQYDCGSETRQGRGDVRCASPCPRAMALQWARCTTAHSRKLGVMATITLPGIRPAACHTNVVNRNKRR